MAKKQICHLWERHCENLSLLGDVDCDGEMGFQDLVFVASACGSNTDELRWIYNVNWLYLGTTEVSQFGQYCSSLRTIVQ